MPVLVNTDSGLAENLADHEAQSALQSGTHEVPLYDPHGNFGSAAMQDAPDLIQQGYTQPNSEQLKDIHKQGKYGTTEQEAKTFLEGAASGLTFGESAGLERALGVDPADIQGRREVNPGIRGLGEFTSLVGSVAAGVGEGALLGKAAEAVFPAMEGANFAGRVGSAAAKGAVENMIFQVGDENSKLLSSDPTQSVETAVSDIGLSGLLGAGVGGAFGTASELWKAGPGKNVDSILNTIKNRSNGVPEELKISTGIHIPPEIEAGLSDNPYAQQALREAREGSSSYDKKIQGHFEEFYNNVKNAAGFALGKSPEQVEDIIGRNVSEYDTGKEVKDQLIKEFKQQVEPVTTALNDFGEKFKTAPVSDTVKSDIAMKVANTISEMGLDKSSSAAESLKLAQNLLEDLPKQTNANDLKLLAQNLKAKDPSQYGIIKELKKAVNSGWESSLEQGVLEQAPQMTADFKKAKLDYGGVKDLIEELNSRLHSGKAGGPDSFISNLKEMSPESVLRRLGPKGDKDLGQLMDRLFPSVSEKIKAHELDKIIQGAGKDGELSIKKLFRNIENMGADLRDFAITPEIQQKLVNIKAMADRVPNSSSFTSRLSDKLWSKLPPGVGALIGLLSKVTDNSTINLLLGGLASHIGSEAGGATRYAMLKFLGSGAETSGEGFMAATKLAAATARGESLLNNGIKNVVGTGGKVIPMPTPKALKVLEAQVKKVAENDPDTQKDMLSIGGATSHYLPDHGAALAMTGARNLQYLASMRPPDKALSPLDSDPKPNSEQQAKYQRALQIAEQPLIVLNSVKRGNVTVQDIAHLKQMYPALYQRMNQKLMDDLVAAAHGEKKLPYSTKMGISSFMGQPLDSTMTPQSIISIQQSIVPQIQQQQNTVKPSASGMNNLQKMPGMSMTPMQNREYYRGGRH